MKRYFTSDFHFDHANVIKYCNRPFVDVDEMNRVMLNAWNSVVTDADEVYFLGDFCFNGNKALWWLSQLKGKIIFISGNHDQTFAKDGKTKHIKWIESYKTAGVAEVHQKLTLKLKNNVEVLLCHFPYLDNNASGDIRYLEYRPKNQGQWLLHGHSHCHYVKHHKMIDVGIDHNFKLYSEDDIIDLMSSKETTIDSRISEFYRNKKSDQNQGEY